MVFAAKNSVMTIQLFKWLMALVLVMFLPVLFERLCNIRKTDAKHSDEYLRERVRSIYFDVTHFYNQLGTLRDDVGGPEVWPDFDRQYCSKAWNESAAAIAQHEEAEDCESPATGLGNYWIGGGYFARSADGLSGLGFLYTNKVEVIDHTGDQGTVSLMLHNGEEALPVLLNMVFEGDDWYIDNITYNWYVRTGAVDWRQEMALRS